MSTVPAGGVPIAAIVVSYRTGARLFSCLDAALAAPDIARIVVVDNGNPSADEARLDALAAQHDALTVLRGAGNVGFAKACNRGAASVAAEHLLFLNPDAVIAPGAAAALVAAGETHAHPWIAGGRIVDLEGREQRGGRRAAPTLKGALKAFLGRASDGVHLENEPVPAGPVEVGAVSGACLAMRADDFAQLGGFDERYFLHVEDLDICRRAQLAGGAVVYVPGAEAVHEGATSDASSLFVEWCKGRGLARYFVRFADGPVAKAAAVLLSPVIVAAAVARGLIRR